MIDCIYLHLIYELLISIFLKYFTAFVILYYYYILHIILIILI